MRMNTLTMSREAVSPSPRRTVAKTDRKRSKGPEIRRTGNPPRVTLQQIRCQFVYGIKNQPQLSEIQSKLQLELPRILEIRRIRNRSAFRRYQAERIGAIDV